MSGAVDIPVLAAALSGGLLIAGAAITLVGALGLLRLETFYQRVHAPTLGTTLGTACVAVASIIYFSALGSRPVIHELLIVIFITVTTPISLIVVVRASVLRDESKSEKETAARAESER